jgi:hypothetical protein
MVCEINVNVGKTINLPPNHHYIGGINHSQMGGLWHCFTHILIFTIKNKLNMFCWLAKLKFTFD